MYKGKQPFYVISTLTLLIVVLGLVLVFLTMHDENEALTGSSVIAPSREPTTHDTETLPLPLPMGSKSIPFDPRGREIVDFQLNQEIQAGHYTIKVIGARVTDKIGIYLSPESFQGKKADKVYYTFQIQITNMDSKEGYTPENLFTLTDGAQEYSIDPDGTKYFYKDSLFYPVLRKDVKRNGRIAFDAASGSYRLLVHGDEKIYRMNADA